MFRFFAKLALPFFCLCCSVVWMFYDMHQIPQGNQDFQLRDLQSPKNWLTPIAFNPRKARETVLGGQGYFKTINCKDELHCWVAGSYGNAIVTLTTDDGGLTWKKFAEFIFEQYIGGIHLAADLQHGWAVGADGEILATSDGGKTWQAQASPTEASLSGIHMAADLQHGWAVGERGTILATNNGGNTWQAQDSSTNASLQGIHMAADLQHGWVVGANGIILATSDSGKTWQAQDSSTNAWLQGIHMAADLQHGWAVGMDMNRTILATSDGGKTWQAQDSSTNAWLQGIHMAADLQHGWAVGMNMDGIILATSDGGKTWQNIASTAFYRAMSFANRGKGWAAGMTSHRGEVFSTSDDYGKTWQEVAIPQGKWIQSIHPSYDAKQIAILSGDNETGGAAANRLLISRDAGKTWQESNLKKVIQEGNVFFLNVYFSSDFSKGWLLTTSGEIWASVDSGNTWKKQGVISNEKQLIGWYVANNLQNMWIVGSFGLILASVDGGKTWKKQPSPIQESLYSIQMAADLQHGWAVGWGGTILATSNGGSTWEESSLVVAGKKVTERLNYVNFFDDKHGVIGSRSGSIFTTDDGGATWAKTGQVDHRGDVARIYPAPAALALAALSLLWLLALLLRLSTDPRALRHADQGGVDDNPIEHPLDDRLGNLGIARALALLFLSKDTAPPLAVAVCAPWGAGKSSLLRLLQRELRLSGARPVWFNAWHYREDTQLLAALMEHIRDQAKLSGWELGSLRFRAMLLWMRVLKKWLGVVLLLAIVLVALDKAWPPYGWGAVAELRHWLDPLQALREFGANVPPWASNDNALVKFGLKIPENSPALSFLLEWQDKLPQTGLVLSLLTLVAVGYGLKKKTEPFTPAMLKAAKWLQTQTSVASMEKEAGFRYLFSREFTEVCTALGKGKLVLILDDLDRCDPSQIDKIMSTLNFLFSHAPCHAVLGMDWNYVRGAVGLAYEKLASEMARGSKDDGRKQRAEFGEAFLEKIVQLRFNVPTQNSAAVVFRHSHLIDLRTPTPSIPWRNLPGRLASYGKQGKHVVGQAWRGLRQRSWAENWQHSIMRLRQLRRGAWYGWLALWHSTGDEIATAVARRDPGLFSRLLGFTLGCTVLFYVVAWGGREIKAYLHPEAVSTQTQARAGDVTPGIKDKVIDEKPRDPDKNKPREGGGDVEIVLNPEANSASNVVWAFPSVALGLTLFWLVWAAAQIKDSAGFIQAVRFWSKSLHGKLSTPRAWRRFQNLARFYAMRLRVERQETQGWGRVWRQMRLHLGAWLRQRQVPGDTVEQDEGLLVSLLALGLLGHGKLLHSVCQQLSYPQLERDSVANLHECLQKCQRQCTPERQQALADLLAKITPTPAHLATKLVLPPSDWRNLQKLATEFAAFPALASFLTQLSATTHADLPYLPERVAAHLRTLVPEALPPELASQLNTLLNPPVLEQHPDRYASLQQILDFTLAGLVTVLGEMAEGETRS